MFAHTLSSTGANAVIAVVVDNKVYVLGGRTTLDRSVFESDFLGAISSESDPLDGYSPSPYNPPVKSANAPPSQTPISESSTSQSPST